jgi:Pro-kumamolisin, activation domain/Bacterial Ig-like domain (group 3)
MFRNLSSLKFSLRSVLSTRVALLPALLLFVAGFAHAQQAAANPARITQAVDNSVKITLKGNVHPLANAKFDRGAVVASLPMKRMLMVLKRSDVQEAALKTYLDQQQDKHSANFHQWLTPTQMGQKYGPNSADIKTITTWLESQGFEIGSVAKSGMFIEFSGTAGQVASAFNTEVHSYLVDGQLQQANASDPQIPAALAPVVAGFASLNNFPRKPANHFLGSFTREKSSGKVTQVAGKKPGFTYADSNGSLYLLGPYDLATIYNIEALWNAGLDGTGQTIAIVGQTDINLADANNFRAIFGLPANPPNIIVNGIDPGFTGDEGEADIDTQWSGAVAKNATIDFVTSAGTETTAGIDLSALYIVENNLAPVMSESYLDCEANLGNGGNQFYYTLWEQAASQGITVLLSAGDSGSANCDYGVNGGTGDAGAKYGLTVSGMSSTPFDLAVGGTDFDQIDNSPTKYWSATNNSTTQASALGYIPETTWNNSCTNDVFSGITGTADPLSNCNNSAVQDTSTYSGLQVTGGAGGPSNCAVSTATACLSGYQKPAWQVGTFNDTVRDTPDISLFASNGFAGTFYVVCDQDADAGDQACSLAGLGTTFQGYGGTSVASPALAGMFSILNQKLGARVGNANYALYNLAATEGAATCNSTTGPGASCIFNDVTKGTISEPCQAGTTNCYSTTGDSYGVLVSDNGTGYATPDSSGYPSDLGWNTAVGYDYATGLGTLNAYNLVEEYSSANFISSAITLALSSASFTHGTSVNASVTVTSTTGTPSGDVSFNSVSAGTGVPNGSVGFAPLSGGTAQVALNSLPGGSYNVVAHYGGNNDGTNLFAGSDSNPVAVTVAPEGSTTTMTSVLHNPVTRTSAPGITATYGAYLILPRVDVAGTSGLGSATGTVALTANGTAIPGSPFKLNSQGNTEDQNFAGTAGTYAFSASYSGDPSFNASVGTGTLTVTQQTPTGSLTSSASSVTQGTSVTLSAVFDTTTYVGVAPTGTVTFYAGTTALGAPVTVAAGADPNNFPEAGASLATTTIPVGTNAVTAVYSGDVNYATATSPATSVTVTGVTPTLAISGTAVAAITQGASGTSTITVTPGSGFTGAVNLTCSVAGPTGATSPATCSYVPTSVTISGTTAGTSLLTVATTATTTAGSYTVTLNASGTGNVTAPPATLPVTVNAAGFSGTFTIAATDVSAAPGATSGNTSAITVTPSPGATGTGTLNLSCALTGSPTGANAPPTCSLSAATLSLNGATPLTATATIASTANTSGALAFPQTNRNHHWYIAAGGAALACVLFFGIPARRRGWKSMLGLLFFLVTMTGVGCGGGGGNNNPTGGTTAGSYTFTITGATGTGNPSTTVTQTFTVTIT